MNYKCLRMIFFLIYLVKGWCHLSVSKYRKTNLRHAVKQLSITVDYRPSVKLFLSHLVSLLSELTYG